MDNIRSFKDKNMEDLNRDSQDSETSSTSSWILISEEAAEDEVAERNQLCISKAVEKLVETDFKNNQSDIESDGISIISESEFSHDGRSDDDTAIASGDELESTDELHGRNNENSGSEDKDSEQMEDDPQNIENLINNENITQHLEEERVADVNTTTGKSCDYIINECTKESNVKTDEDTSIVLSDKNFEKDDNKGNMKSKKLVAYGTRSHETKETNDSTEDEVENIFSEKMINNVQKKTPETHISSCLNNFNQIYDYKNFLTWPSLLGTSVIFAVLIVPYFSSKINSTLDHPNIEEYDVNLLPDKKIVDVDPLAYCKEIHKNGDLYHDYDTKKCMKRILKQIKKAKKSQIAREVKFLDREIDKRKSDDILIENQEIEINYKKMYKKENDKEYKHQKYMKKYKYNNINKDQKVFHKNDEYDFENTENEGYYEKNWNFAQKEVSSKGNDPNDPDVIVKGKNKDFEFVYEIKHNGDNIEKHWNYQQKEKSDDQPYKEGSKETSGKEYLRKWSEELKKKKKYLMEREKILNEWEERLIKREKNIQEEEQRNKKIGYGYGDEMYYDKTEKLDRINKRKGDFDDDDDVQEHKLRKTKKHHIFEEASNEYEKYTPRNKHDKRTRKSRLYEVKSKEHYAAKNSKKNEDLGKIKTFFRNENFEKFKEKKDSHFQLFQENDQEPITEVNDNSEHNSKYLKVQNVQKKNRTRILDDDNVTVTGEWYLNLVQGRQDVRKKEEKAIWWFDRAISRKNKRNKAYWYFHYMFNRENLRYRPKNI